MSTDYPDGHNPIEIAYQLRTNERALISQMSRCWPFGQVHCNGNCSGNLLVAPRKISAPHSF